MARPKGAESRNTRGMKARLKQQFGDDFDVIMLMGKNCMALMSLIPENPTSEDAQSIIDANVQLDKLANYLEPKLKAIELDGTLDASITIVRKEYKPSK